MKRRQGVAMPSEPGTTNGNTCLHTPDTTHTNRDQGLQCLGWLSQSGTALHRMNSLERWNGGGVFDLRHLLVMTGTYGAKFNAQIRTKS